jgi:hypothetical protein
MMTKILLTLALTGLVPVSAWADVSKEEIKRLLSAGVSEDVVLTFIQQHGPVAPLQSDDLVELRQAGAGDRVLSALLAGQQVPDADPPLRPCTQEVVSGGVFGAVYVYDPSLRICLPVRRSRPVEPVCTWAPTFTPRVPRCSPPVVSCRPAVPVCRPACPPAVRCRGRR